ncbi:hypothetical protein KSF78_0001821 [Schistosoma japonicum]|nr:hypothetical protein KSF78_0001821 [Schistosoma japonicum]
MTPASIPINYTSDLLEQSEFISNQPANCLLVQTSTSWHVLLLSLPESVKMASDSGNV